MRTERKREKLRTARAAEVGNEVSRQNAVRELRLQLRRRRQRNLESSSTSGSKPHPCPSSGIEPRTFSGSGSRTRSPSTSFSETAAEADPSLPARTSGTTRPGFGSSTTGWEGLTGSWVRIPAALTATHLPSTSKSRRSKEKLNGVNMFGVRYFFRSLKNDFLFFFWWPSRLTNYESRRYFCPYVYRLPRIFFDLLKAFYFDIST